jgi:hypothetical protein
MQSVFNTYFEVRHGCDYGVIETSSTLLVKSLRRQAMTDMGCEQGMLVEGIVRQISRQGGFHQIFFFFVQPFRY